MARRAKPAQSRDARKQAAYRARLKAMGLAPASGKHASKFDAGDFVAVDGEGFNVGPELRFVVGEHAREYRTQDHHYALLTASDGAEIYNPHGRLKTSECLNFLCDITERNPRAILVCFGGSYDMCHMLAFGLSRDELTELLHGSGDALARKTVDVTLDGYDYRIELRNRKSLSVWRWEEGADKYEQHTKKDGSTVWRMTKCSKAVLWDVWGFFQGTFADAMKNWLHGDADYEFIQKMKGERSLFTRDEIDTIRRYNQAELRCLVAMMNKVRDAIRAVNLKITRWDGAGSIAGAMLKQHEIQQHMAKTPAPVFEAARVAYSGGHIEALKLGYHKGTIHHYDINSAYPAEFAGLPSLANGTWHHGTGNPPAGFTLVKLAYRFRPGAPFYPLFYREINGIIRYPERGAGWYWYPEFDAAREFVERFGCVSFTILEYWHFHPSLNVAPFGFIGDYYARRQRIVEETRRTGIPNGEEKTLKLGYNSIYGKAAQQVGARRVNGEIVEPSYFQLEWAGFVTSGCRAKLARAGMQAPGSIISFATDGIFSLTPLDLYCPEKKELGAWEYQTHTGMTMVMPGVYWLHDGDKVKGYSRGFDKKTMSDADFIHQAWSRKKSELDMPSRRLVTLGTALMSDNFWKMRGLFTETVRELKINGATSKRHAVAMHNVKLHKSMVASVPQDILAGDDVDLLDACSEAYPIDWIKPEDSAENAETAELTDADKSFFFDKEALTLV